MIYVVMGVGTPSPLDKEHIINTMFKATSYGKKIYFFKDMPASDVALEAAKQWKDLNNFPVEFVIIDENNPKQRSLLPSVFDCVLYFIDEKTANDKIFSGQLKVLDEEGIRYEKYVLGTWDKQATT
jgi:hypothetical protein